MPSRNREKSHQQLPLKKAVRAMLYSLPSLPQCTQVVALLVAHLTLPRLTLMSRDLPVNQLASSFAATLFRLRPSVFTTCYTTNQRTFHVKKSVIPAVQWKLVLSVTTHCFFLCLRVFSATSFAEPRLFCSDFALPTASRWSRRSRVLGARILKIAMISLSTKIRTQTITVNNRRNLSKAEARKTSGSDKCDDRRDNVPVVSPA